MRLKRQNGKNGCYFDHIDIDWEFERSLADFLVSWVCRHGPKPLTEGLLKRSHLIRFAATVAIDMNVLLLLTLPLARDFSETLASIWDLVMNGRLVHRVAGVQPVKVQVVLRYAQSPKQG